MDIHQTRWPILRTALILMFMILASALGLAAEYGAQRQALDGFAKQIASIEKKIPDNASDDANLVALRVDLEGLSKAILGFGVSLRPRLVEINRRLAELGSPPKEGEPAESQIIADERRALIEEKSISNALLGEAEALSIRVSRAVDQISALRRELFANTLFKRTDVTAVLNSEVFEDFSREMGTVFRQVSARLQFMLSFRQNSLFGAFGLSLLLGLSTYLGVRRAFGSTASWVREDDEGSYIGRLSLAFWSTVVPSLTVAAALAVTYGLFVYFNVFNEQTRALAQALLIGAAAIFFMQRLANALFAPLRPKRRLIMVSDRAAHKLVILTIAIAAVHVLDYVLSRVNVIFSSPLSLTVAKSLVSSLVISVLLISIALVKPFRSEDRMSAKGWPAFVRYPLILMALFIIGAALAGYIGLARFAAAQIVVTGAIVATMYIGVQSGHVLAAEGAFPRSSFGQKVRGWFALDDTTLDQLGLVASFLIYGVVFLVGLPLILLQWGFNWVDIRAWLYAILTDITIGSMTISLAGIVLGAAIFIIGFLATRRFQGWLDGNVMARSRVDSGVRNSIRTIVGYAGIALAALIALSAAGFNLSNIALVAGALSVGIGFGLQSIVNNFVSGLILLAERPFKVGDWIVAGNTAGLVKKISVRVTEIETFQRQTVILPNSELINNPVGNWTHRNPTGRIDIKVGAAYWETPRRVHAVLMEVAAKNPGVLKSPAPNAVFGGFGATSLDFELQVHVADITHSSAIATALRFEIVEAFAANKIALPFPEREPRPEAAASAEPPRQKP